MRYMADALRDDRNIIRNLQEALEATQTTLEHLREHARNPTLTASLLFENHDTTITHEQWHEAQERGYERFRMLYDSTSEEQRTYEGVSREEVRERQKSVDRWWEHPGWSPCDMLKLFEEPPKHWVCGVCERGACRRGLRAYLR